MNCNYKSPKVKSSITLYDLNKQAVTQQPPLENFESSLEILNNYLTYTKNIYYMLLCKDKSYYTVFVRKNNPDLLAFDKEFIDCIQNFGTIKSINMSEDEAAIEIWVTLPEENDSYVMYLFGYDQGVIECQ